MLLCYFHSSPGLVFSVNFALFNEIISSLSAKPMASVSCRNCLSPQFLPGGRGSGRSSGHDEQKDRLLFLKPSVGNGYAGFPDYLLLLFQAHEWSEYWS